MPGGRAADRLRRAPDRRRVPAPRRARRTDVSAPIISVSRRHRRRPPATPPRRAAGLTWLSAGLILMAAGGCQRTDDGGGQENAGRTPSAMTTVAAPDFALTTLDGATVRLSDYRGKVVLLDFWATWCGPCRMSIPHLKQLYTELGAGGADFEIIGIAVGDREPVVRRFVKSEGIDYVICLGDQAVAAAYAIQSIPTAYLVDRDGTVVARYLGFQHERVLEEAVRGLL
jgi:thiol-disulfide isomerase/thioredoxin